MPPMGAYGAYASWLQSHFCGSRALSLQFDSYSALLLCCLACSAAFVDFYCLSGLVLPLSICCLACSAAFVDFYCLSGHGRLCRLLLPLSTLTAFINFYCLCRLALPLSDFSVVVRYYCLYQLLLPLSACTACVWFCCRCRLCWLCLLDVATCLSYQLFCFTTWLADSYKLCPCIGTGPL